MTVETQATKVAIYKWDYVKLKSICTANMKRWTTQWMILYAYIFKIYNYILLYEAPICEHFLIHPYVASTKDSKYNMVGIMGSFHSTSVIGRSHIRVLSSVGSGYLRNPYLNMYRLVNLAQECRMGMNE